MSQKTITSLIDDLDGGEASRTAQFSWEGNDYEIDLNDEHYTTLEQVFADWVSYARKVYNLPASAHSPRRNAAARRRSSEIRTWAKDNGIEVSDRGRIPEKTVRQFDKAHA
jgi:Lsr2